MAATISSLRILHQLSCVIVVNACLTARGNFRGRNPEQDENRVKVTGVR